MTVIRILYSLKSTLYKIMKLKLKNKNSSKNSDTSPRSHPNIAQRDTRCWELHNFPNLKHTFNYRAHSTHTHSHTSDLRLFLKQWHPFAWASSSLFCLLLSLFCLHVVNNSLIWDKSISCLNITHKLLGLDHFVRDFWSDWPLMSL